VRVWRVSDTSNERRWSEGKGDTTVVSVVSSERRYAAAEPFAVLIST
jgi:hypothetical protein